VVVVLSIYVTYGISYVMPLLPAQPLPLQVYKNDTLPSWGGSVIETPGDTNTNITYLWLLLPIIVG